LDRTIAALEVERLRAVTATDHAANVEIVRISIS